MSVALNWVCAGRRCWQVPRFAIDRIAGTLAVLQRLFPQRVRAQTWGRYAFQPASFAPLKRPAPPLTPMSEELVAQLRRHPDHDANQVRSGLRWWDHGLRQAFIWMDAEGPVCMQWLVTARDNAALRTLPVWAGMYPPIRADAGQIENLFVFSNVHRVGVAVQFIHAMYDVMRCEGLTEIITHIPDDNAPMRALAERLGWTRYGSIIRHQLDVPGLSPGSVFLHRASAR